MKFMNLQKCLYLLCILCFSFLLCSCASESDYVKKYKKACAEYNFDEAREVLQKMKKKKVSRGDKLLEHWEYVDNYELNCVLEEGNFVYAHELLNQFHNDFIATLLEDEILIDVSASHILRRKYYTALEKVYINEIAYVLANNNVNSNKKVELLLMEIPLDGKYKIGIEYYIYCTEDYDWAQHLFAAIYSRNTINQICDNALTLAINSGDRNLANSIIELYKEDIVVTKGSREKTVRINGVVVDGDHGYIEKKWTTKNAAKQRVNAAIKEGRLK